MTTEHAPADELVIDRKKMNQAYRKGLWGAFWLAVMTIVEFIIADVGDGEPWALWALLPFVLAKGWIILDTFMHIRALWSDDH